MLRVFMMKEKNRILKEDDHLREIIQAAKKEAPENLHYRIMHQIETERRVAPIKTNKQNESGKVLKEFGTIFGTMYALLAVIIAVTYYLFGEEQLLSSRFISTVLLITSIFSVIWLISRLDAHLHRRGKYKKENLY